MFVLVSLPKGGSTTRKEFFSCYSCMKCVTDTGIESVGGDVGDLVAGDSRNGEDDEEIFVLVASRPKRAVKGREIQSVQSLFGPVRSLNQSVYFCYHDNKRTFFVTCFCYHDNKNKRTDFSETSSEN